MAALTHSSMGKNPTIQSEPTPKKIESLVVEDLSAFEGTPAVEVAQVPVPKQSTLSEGDKKKMEDVLFMGRTAQIVEVVGHKFELSTLTHKEYNTLIKELGKKETANTFDIRTCTLAFALRSIDGIKLEDLPTEMEYASVIDKRVDLIDNMQLKVIERLFAEYDKLSTEADKLVAADNLKK
jgi:hypothetical protein